MVIVTRKKDSIDKQDDEGIVDLTCIAIMLFEIIIIKMVYVSLHLWHDDDDDDDDDDDGDVENVEEECKKLI